MIQTQISFDLFQKEEVEHLSGSKSDFMLWFQKEEIEPLWRVKVRFHALVSKRRNRTSLES